MGAPNVTLCESGSPARVTVSRIVERVADEFGVPAWVLTAADGAWGTRQRWAVWPRQAAMALAREIVTTPYYQGGGHRISISYPEIGKLFGHRDHTTVIYACRAVAKRRKSDSNLDERLKRLALELLEARP